MAQITKLKNRLKELTAQKESVNNQLKTPLEAGLTEAERDKINKMEVFLTKIFFKLKKKIFFRMTLKRVKMIWTNSEKNVLIWEIEYKQLITNYNTNYLKNGSI